MGKILIFILVAFCSLSSFGQAKKDTTKATKKTAAVQTQKKEETPVSSSLQIAAEEYAVYMAILGKDSKLFVVRDKSGVDNFGEDNDFFKEAFEKAFKELKPETIEDFKAKNKEISHLEKKFPTKETYYLISDEELSKFFYRGLDWEGFNKKYPNSGGFYTFSRVGFSKDGTQAILFVAHSCGSLCGEGYYYFLRNDNGEWKVIAPLMTWIS